MLPPPLTAIAGNALEAGGPVVLAVSGGMDSMALLHLAAASRAGAQVAAVATFDHGTGPAAASAAALVQREAARLGFVVECGIGAPARSESAWRDARWRFLRKVAESYGARVATAHTFDDHVETICMRILRGSGARGLAGLLVEGSVVRPLIGVRRATLAAWAAEARVPFAEDPTNRSRDFLRNRIRLDLLPAIDAVNPGFRDELAAIGEAAAVLRREVEDFTAALPARVGHELLTISRVALAPFDRPALGLIWPALAARAGFVLDRRGTDRLVAFTSMDTRTGARVQLAGGVEVIARRADWLVRRSPAKGTRLVALADGIGVGGWTFRSVTSEGPLGDDPSRADLPKGVSLEVRSWQPGDRMRRAHDGASRRVKRFLSDARIVGPERRGWPVVIAGGEIVWIPGVSRSDAAADRSGGPAVRFVCERATD